MLNLLVKFTALKVYVHKVSIFSVLHFSVFKFRAMKCNMVKRYFSLLKLTMLNTDPSSMFSSVYMDVIAIQYTAEC